MLFVIGLFGIMKIHTWFRSYKVSRKKKENENEITLPFRIKSHQLFLSPLCFSGFVFYFVRRSLLPTRLEQANNSFLFCIVLYFFCSCFFYSLSWELSMNLIIRNWPIIFPREPGFHTVDSLRCLARP